MSNGTDALLASLGRIEVLRDPDGVPYDAGQLSCTYLPHLWDEDAEPIEKRHAAWLCRYECPATTACRATRNQLSTAAEGVWAGTVIRRRRPRDPTDPVVREWAEVYGLPLPEHPKPAKKKGKHDAML